MRRERGRRVSQSGRRQVEREEKSLSLSLLDSHWNCLVEKRRDIERKKERRKRVRDRKKQRKREKDDP